MHMEGMLLVLFVGVEENVYNATEQDLQQLKAPTIQIAVEIIMVDTRVDTLPAVVTQVVDILAVAVQDLHLHDALALLAMVLEKAWTKSTIVLTTLVETILDIAVNVEALDLHTPIYANHARYAMVKGM